MAIDTENKRRSAVFSMLPFTIMPEPSLGLSDADRVQAAWLYSGIAIATAAANYLIYVWKRIA